MAGKSGKTIGKELDKTITEASRATKKARQIVRHKVSKTVKAARGGSYKCKICGKESKSAVDAIAHLLDHGSSALEEISSLIKNQKEGRISKEEKAKGRKESRAG